MSWDKKLKRLQENLKLTQEGLASTLGITTRTLSDFMNPASDREPTGPIQKLIDLLSNEIDSPNAPVKKPQLNLVVIHGDFRTPPDQDAVSLVVEMHAAAGTQRNNEFHYVTVEPERDKKWALEGLIKRRVSPHFFVCEAELNNQEARDCYFTATTVWLAAQAMRRDLAHITLAADPVKFWPLARELNLLTDVDVTFVREVGSNRLMDQLLEKMKINVADPVGRNLGVVSTLKASADQRGTVTYGYIEPDGKKGKLLFFSWNHMRKDKKGLPEWLISELREGDRVSYGIGMNNEGECATDVALVFRAQGAAPEPSSLLASVMARGNRSEESILIDTIKDAVNVCANADGWALCSDVGNRANIISRDFTVRLKKTFKNGLMTVLREHPDVFDSDVPGGPGTERVRLCPLR